MTFILHNDIEGTDGGSRLCQDRLKRVDRVIAAFLALQDQNLVLTSSGPETRTLMRLARRALNIRFVGPPSRDALQGGTVRVRRHHQCGVGGRFRHVRSGVHGFGQAGHRPGTGGLAETVVHGVTGIHISSDPGPAEVREAVLALRPPRAEAMREECLRRTRRDDTTHFLEAMRQSLLPQAEADIMPSRRNRI